MSRIPLRLATALTLVATSVLAATQGGPIPVPLPLFPANNWWNTDVSNAPTDLNSANFISHINFDPVNMVPKIRHVHADWGGDVDPIGSPGFVYGFPYIIVDGNQTPVTVQFDTPEESDGVDHNTETSFPFYPIPAEAITQSGWIEDGPAGNVDDRPNSDRHMLIVDKTHNYLYELYNVFYTGGQWTAFSGAFFDMNTNNRRPDTWTSADAAGLAMLPGIVRYDEVYGPNEITHAFRFTVRDTNNYVFPASHVAGSSSGALPMGARLRLKASYDISTFPADVQKIMRALKKYGLIVADNGSDMFIQGNYDNNWGDMSHFNSSTTGLGKLTADDFEVVQLGYKPSFSYILSLPSVMGSGDTAGATLTVYDANYNLATGYTGTVHFTSTDGSATLPADYTFVPADNGAHTFNFILRTTGGQTVYATDTGDPKISNSRNVIVGPNAPTNLVATATGNNINLNWTASTGAGLQYEIQRLSSSSPTYATVTTTASTTFGEAVAAGTEYVYKVRAIDTSMRYSPFSVPDPATTFSFANDPVAATSTSIQFVHITDLRTAANLIRSAANLAAYPFTGGGAGTSIMTGPINQLRIAILEARTILGLPSITFTDATLFPGTTLVKAAHVQELRNAVK